VDDKQKLVRFVRRVDELRSLRMAKEAAGYKVSLNVDSTKGASMSASFPDEEVLRSFVLAFRQFMAPNEPVHINHILNICWRRSKPNNDFRERLIHAREVWGEALNKSKVGLVFNEQVLTPKHVADLWMNGHYFHNDDDKYAALESMLGYELAFVKAHFIEFIIQGTFVITYVGALVEHALKNDLLRF
jgi:hypothetical protein